MQAPGQQGPVQGQVDRQRDIDPIKDRYKGVQAVADGISANTPTSHIHLTSTGE